MAGKRRGNILATVTYSNKTRVEYRKVSNATMRAEWSTGTNYEMPTDWLPGILSDASYAGYQWRDYRHEVGFITHN